jgi:hypothetical protein
MLKYGQLQTTTSEQVFNAQMKVKFGSENAAKGLNLQDRHWAHWQVQASKAPRPCTKAKRAWVLSTPVWMN